jgi:hypothetical protein
MIGKNKVHWILCWASKINQPTKSNSRNPENKYKQIKSILDQMGLKIEVENDKETLTINKLMVI